ncbi:MAG: LPS export ABC transporter periplasmic protein LptC [bacterium]
MLRKIIPRLLIIIFLISTLTLYKSLRKKTYPSSIPVVSKEIKNVKLPEAILKNFKLQQIKKSTQENWSLIAQEGKIFYSTKNVECKHLKCSYNKNNKLIAILNANKGLVDQDKKEAFLQGDVFGNINDLNFQGKNIRYDFEKHTMQTNEKTILNHPKFKFICNSSFAKIKENEIFMNGKVETEIYL